VAFRNAKNILKSCPPLDSYKLLLATAMISRPKYQALWLALLRPFISNGQFEFSYRCYGIVRHATVRLSELSSDMQIVWELCVRDTYAIDPEFAPDLVIDGGGNIGFFSLRMTALAASTGRPETKFVIIEPVSQNIETLKKNLKANGIVAEIKQACLGGTRAVLPFYVREAMQGSFDPREPYTSVIEVPVIRIQDAIGSSRAERILVKLDIEGVELEALRAYVPSERRAVYILGELHDVQKEASLIEALFHEHGWVCELYETYDNLSHFRAYSPAALPLTPMAVRLSSEQSKALQ
jgi:FkbM family methyltransferase